MGSGCEVALCRAEIVLRCAGVRVLAVRAEEPPVWMGVADTAVDQMQALVGEVAVIVIEAAVRPGK